MNKKIGTVTIGQSPRVDVIPDISAILGPEVEIIESGALDGLTKEEIAKFAPEAGDYVLVTRLRDGSSVQVAERYITPRVEEKINAHFKNGISLVLLLCTGEFPDLEPAGLLLSPQKILFGVAAAVGSGRKIGILTPSVDQVVQSEKRWSSVSERVKSLAASPYADGMTAVEKAALDLREWGAEITILDCIGYTRPMQELVCKVTEKPAILGRGIAGRVVAELLL